MFSRLNLLLAALLFSVGASPSFAAHAVAAAEVVDGMRYYWNVNLPNKKVAEQKVMKTCSENAKRTSIQASANSWGLAMGLSTLRSSIRRMVVDLVCHPTQIASKQ